jgi:hypothetical protein
VTQHVVGKAGEAEHAAVELGDPDLLLGDYPAEVLTVFFWRVQGR